MHACKGLLGACLFIKLAVALLNPVPVAVLHFASSDASHAWHAFAHLIGAQGLTVLHQPDSQQT